MRNKLANFIYNINIPEWTKKVGQPWDYFYKAPWNLYNLIWMAQHNLFYFITRDPRK